MEVGGGGGGEGGGGGRSSVVRESEFKPEDPGFDPMAGQIEEQIVCTSSESTFVQTCLVRAHDHPSYVRHAPQVCAHVNNPISLSWTSRLPMAYVWS